jgi:hypothetical protein
MKNVISTSVAALFFAVAIHAQSAPASQISVVRYCDLLAKPEAYDGKQIRLRAEYDSGWEHSVFADDKCVKTWEPRKLVWADFDDGIASNTQAAIMARFEKSRWRPETDRDGRITDKWRSWRVSLTVVGVFHKATDANFGFGNTNSFPFMIRSLKLNAWVLLKNYEHAAMLTNR